MVMLYESRLEPSDRSFGRSRGKTGFAAGVFTGTEDSWQEFYQNIDGILNF